MRVEMIPARTDNYLFVLRKDDSRQVVVLDPADFVPVDDYLRSEGLSLSTIWVTHHHHDHTDGIEELKQAYGCKVIAGKRDSHRIRNVDRWVVGGDEVEFQGHRAKVLDVPGHTLGHMAYHFTEEKILFSADVIFVAGCGRLFEGTPAMMLESIEKLAQLPDETIVYCSHEYTLANLEFALSLEPEHAGLLTLKARVEELRSKGLYTVPTTIGAEKSYNPFLRCRETSLQKAVGLEGADPAEVFAEVRRRKDTF